MPTDKSKRTVITNWLILGSFPSPRRESILPYPYIPEESAAPLEGLKTAGRKWCTARTARDGRIDLLAMKFPAREFCAAYAAVYIHSGEVAQARLMIGADDGVAVWLNGSKVWQNDVGRAYVAGQDIMSVSLDAGWNRLLIKISQYVGAWEFSCAVESRATLKFSVLCPLAGRPATDSAKVALCGARCSDNAPAGKFAFDVDIYNRLPRPVHKLRVALCGSDGSEWTSATAARVGRCGLTTVRIEGETGSLIDLLRNQGAQWVVTQGKTRTSFPVAGLPAQVLLHAATGQTQDPGAATEAARTRQTIAAYGLSLDQVTPKSLAGLSALHRGDWTALAENLRQLMDAALCNVPDRKSETVQVIGHAHIDMNWLWTWPETVKTCHDSFRQVIAFMEEFSDFTFLQSQSATYRTIEEIDPPLFRKIRERVRDGRWEIVGGMVTEGDTNMSGGEALVRSFLLAQRYFMDRFGKTACIGWLPDNFGHTSQLPQILRLAGCEFFYFHRCRPHFGTFWWEGPDGSRVLAYSNETYNGSVNPALLKEIDRVVPQKKRLLCVCGVGDHGGGPTRADIESAHALDRTPRFPSVRFTRAEEFFRRSKEETGDRPVHKGEMQYIFEGCYTTIARIKEGNRRCETALYCAELLAALRRLQGHVVPTADLRRAWEIVTFNQFHDILCGSAINESNADSVADYKWARSRAEQVSDNALRAMADEVGTHPEIGRPIVVFNPHPRERTAIVEAEFFTHDQPATAKLSSWIDFYGGRCVGRTDGGKDGRLPTVGLKTHGGKDVPAQIVWGKVFPPGFRSRIQFVAEDLPACGYRTYYVDASKPATANESMQKREGEFETDFFKVVFNMKTGAIRRLFDRRSRKDFVGKGGGMNRLRIYCEAPHGMSGWRIGPYTKVEDVTDVAGVRVTEVGPVRACVETESRWGRSTFVQRTYLYRSYPRIDFEVEAHWFEQGDKGTDSPMLRVVFPLALRKAEFSNHVPFDVVTRPMSAQEVPAQHWVDVTDGKCGLALLNQTKYGHSFEDNELRMTLLRSSYDPDIYPDQGLHRIAYGLFPHTGDWRNGVWSEGAFFNVPPLAIEPPSMALGKTNATRPEEASHIELTPSNIALSAVKDSEEGGRLVVRFVETDGKDVTACLRLPGVPRSACRLDILERPLADAPPPQVRERTVSVRVHPHEIVTLGIEI